MMTAGAELKPYCPRCGARLKMQIKGVDAMHSQYKCPKCNKTMLGMNAEWREEDDVV